MNKKEIDNGGQAFPQISETRTYIDGGGNKCAEHIAVDGLTVRDFFAAAALQGAWANNGEESSAKYCASTAENCYAMADAMLKARNA